MPVEIIANNEAALTPSGANHEQSFLFMGNDGIMYNSNGARVIVIDNSNDIENSSDGHDQNNVDNSGGSGNDDVFDVNKRVVKLADELAGTPADEPAGTPADEPSLANIFRIQTALAYKVSKMRIDIDNMLQFLKRIDGKMDLLLNGGFGGTSAFAQCEQVPVSIRKLMETVDEFERFEENLKRSDFQEETVCFLSRESVLKHIFTHICLFFADRCIAISIRKSWKS